MGKSPFLIVGWQTTKEKTRVRKNPNREGRGPGEKSPQKNGKPT
jgi:hypothetical protein